MEIYLIYIVVLIYSPVMHIYILFYILFHYDLFQDTEYSSLCYTVMLQYFYNA